MPKYTRLAARQAKAAKLRALIPPDLRQEWEKPRPALSIDEEARIIGMFARGDRTAEIIAATTDEYGRSLSVQTVTSVRRRNANTLEDIRKRAQAAHEADSQKIRDKANGIIKKQLDQAETAQEVLTTASQQYIAGEITLGQYSSLIKSVKSASLAELVNVSKEMNAQTSSAVSPPGDPKDLAAIRAALESGDDVTLTQLVFKKNSNPGANG